MRGASLRAVAELLGHQTMQMTMRYAHLSPGYLTNEVSLLDDVGGAKKAKKGNVPKRARRAKRKCAQSRREMARPAGLEPATSWFVVAIPGSKITEFHWSNSRLPRGAATRTDARSFSAAAHRTNSRSSIAPAATWRRDVAADGTRFSGVVRSKQPRLPAFVLGTSSVVRRRALTIPSGSSQRFNAIRCGRQDNEILLRNSNATRLQPSPAAYGGAEVDSH